MYKKILLISSLVLIFAGCASVPMETPEATKKAKAFESPPEGKVGLYIYRSGSFGGALTKAIWVNDNCIGLSAPNIFFYEEVDGGGDQKIATESEFSPNILTVNTESGKNYFIQQYIKMGVFVGGANLKLVSEEEGRDAVSQLNLAKKGPCKRKD